MVNQIKRLGEIFIARTSDRRTLDELHRMIGERGTWHKAHDLFHRIRLKTNEAHRIGDASLEAQFCFEEVCAKTLYNLTRRPAQFDPDSPYWIVPNALMTARLLGIDEREIIAVVST